MEEYLRIVPAHSKILLKKFIFLPEKLHREHLNWVPPIYAEEKDYFNPKTNLGLEYSDIEPVLCYKGKEIAGRILGIINHKSNQLKNEKVALFSQFECINDEKVACKLLNHVEQWAKSKKAELVSGPSGIYYTDPNGFIIDGFENEPSVATNFNHPYIPELVEQAGYSKKHDLVVYRIDLDQKIPEFYERIYERISKGGKFKIHEFRTKSEIRTVLPSLMDLLNECFQDLDGFTRYSPEEIKSLCQQFLPVLDPKLVKVVSTNDEYVGFIIAMPNISEGVRRANGRLYPLGIFKILQYKKKSRQLDLLLGGVSKRYRGLGIDVLLGYHMIKNAQANNYAFMDSHLEMESNYKVRAEMKKMGGRVYKTYRLYKKFLND
jgi:hypothetical protein